MTTKQFTNKMTEIVNGPTVSIANDIRQLINKVVGQQRKAVKRDSALDAEIEVAIAMSEIL